MVERRFWFLLGMVGLFLVACSNGSSNDVVSAGRQAVEVAPGRSLTSVVARVPVDPIPAITPAPALVPPDSVPDVLAFKDVPSGSAIGSAEVPTTTAPPTTTTVPAVRTVPSTTVTPPSSEAPVEESSTTVPKAVVAGASCPGPRFDNGLLDDASRVVGQVDSDGLVDVVVVGLDDAGAIRVVVDFGDGGQSEVGTLAPFGDRGAGFSVDFTGDRNLPLRVHQGSVSVLVRVENCVPLRAANG